MAAFDTTHIIHSFQRLWEVQTVPKSHLLSVQNLELMCPPYLPTLQHILWNHSTVNKEIVFGTTKPIWSQRAISQLAFCVLHFALCAFVCLADMACLLVLCYLVVSLASCLKTTATKTPPVKPLDLLARKLGKLGPGTLIGRLFAALFAKLRPPN